MTNSELREPKELRELEELRKLKEFKDFLKNEFAERTKKFVKLKTQQNKRFTTTKKILSIRRSEDTRELGEFSKSIMHSQASKYLNFESNIDF